MVFIIEKLEIVDNYNIILKKDFYPVIAKKHICQTMNLVSQICFLFIFIKNYTLATPPITLFSVASGNILDPPAKTILSPFSNIEVFSSSAIPF